MADCTVGVQAMKEAVGEAHVSSHLVGGKRSESMSCGWHMSTKIAWRLKIVLIYSLTTWVKCHCPFESQPCQLVGAVRNQKADRSFLRSCFFSFSGHWQLQSHRVLGAANPVVCGTRTQPMVMKCVQFDPVGNESNLHVSLVWNVFEYWWVLSMLVPCFCEQILAHEKILYVLWLQSFAGGLLPAPESGTLRMPDEVWNEVWECDVNS